MIRVIMGALVAAVAYFGLIIAAAAWWPAGAGADVGRWVDLGPWNGVVDCESSPTAGFPPLSGHTREVRVDQRSHTADRGAFQFQQRTWDWVARAHGLDHLVGVDPRTRTLAAQLRQAERLRTMGGVSHWVCGYRYGDGTGPRYVTGESVMPRHPERCARKLRRHQGVARRVARSVCGVPNDQ